MVAINLPALTKIVYVFRLNKNYTITENIKSERQSQEIWEE